MGCTSSKPRPSMPVPVGGVQRYRPTKQLSQKQVTTPLALDTDNPKVETLNIAINPEEETIKEDDIKIEPIATVDGKDDQGSPMHRTSDSQIDSPEKESAGYVKVDHIIIEQPKIDEENVDPATNDQIELSEDNGENQQVSQSAGKHQPFDRLSSIEVELHQSNTVDDPRIDADEETMNIDERRFVETGKNTPVSTLIEKHEKPKHMSQIEWQRTVLSNKSKSSRKISEYEEGVNRTMEEERQRVKMIRENTFKTFGIREGGEVDDEAEVEGEGGEKRRGSLVRRASVKEKRASFMGNQETADKIKAEVA